MLRGREGVGHVALMDAYLGAVRPEHDELGVTFIPVCVSVHDNSSGGRTSS